MEHAKMSKKKNPTETSENLYNARYSLVCIPLRQKLTNPYT